MIEYTIAIILLLILAIPSALGSFFLSVLLIKVIISEFKRTKL